MPHKPFYGRTIEKIKKPSPMVNRLCFVNLILQGK